MMKRGKVEERRYFTREEKEQILAKTNGVCASCGKLLKIGENFTIEHVIPISKGGTNDMSNLLPLCEACNKEKDDRIMNPVFYKFAPRDLKLQLSNQQIAYYDNCTWLGKHNFTVADKDLMSMSYGLTITTKGKRAADKVFVSGFCIYEKMTYAMMDEVYDYKCKYIEKLMKRRMTQSGKELLKMSMNVDFLLNSSYILRKPGGEILGVITLSWRKALIDGDSCYCLVISKIVMLYPNEANLRRVGNTVMEICTRILTELHLDSISYCVYGESGLIYKLRNYMSSCGALSYGNESFRIFDPHYFDTRTDFSYRPEAKVLREAMGDEVKFDKQVQRKFSEMYPDYADKWEAAMCCLSLEEDVFNRIEGQYMKDIRVLENKWKEDYHKWEARYERQKNTYADKR